MMKGSSPVRTIEETPFLESRVDLRYIYEILGHKSSKSYNMKNMEGIS